MLIGRGPERAAIDKALATAVAGHSAALAFGGAPGIGKTALLSYAAEQAEDLSVLRASGIESEARIAFASLLELLRPILSLLPGLPQPQLIALEQAFALRPGRVEDRFAIGAATLSLLAAAAERQPILLLLDDIQWFDAPSSEALRFALRRLEADPIAAVLALREGHRSLLDGSGIPLLVMDGLSEPEAQALRHDIPAETAARLREATGGNPLALLELTADADELELAPRSAPVMVSARISAAYLRRAAALTDDARACLLLAATSDGGELELLAQAARRLELSFDGLLAAEEAGLVRLGGGLVEFQHPLVRSAVYSDAALGARRAAHRALASVLPDHQIDRRAWHLAAAAVGTDEPASLALEQAGRRAVERSGFATATSAFERAARLTDDRDRRASLLAEAAEAAWGAGRAEHALRLLDESRASAAHAPGLQVACDWLAGRIATHRGPVMQGHATLMRAAELAVAELGAADSAIAMLGDAAIASFLGGDMAALAAVAQRVQKILPITTEPATRIRALTITGVERVLSGDAAAGARLLREAVAMTGEKTVAESDVSLLPWLAIGPMFLRESEAGHANVDAVLDSARRRAVIEVLALVLILCARDQVASDRWRLGEATYREAVALARESDQCTCVAFGLSGLSLLQARQGREEECRATAAEAMLLTAKLGSVLNRLWSLIALGELELALGRPAPALEQFEQARQLAESNSITDVDLWPAAEMVEAYLRLGREEPAHDLTAAFHSAARAKGQPWSLARALRCEGLVADADGFAAHFEAALDHHRLTPDVFELARTHLAYGERLRRARNRVLARAQLRAAEEIFRSLDARPWAGRARTELEATGETLRRGEPDTVAELTPQELQIALMLASGRTTRETAAALFLSPKTIEYHLHHVYLKLGVHSRDALARVDGLSRTPSTQEAATEKTGGSRVAAVHQLAPASPEPNRSPEVAPK
jgi:DNA-binding CsgD family transcriptional regulator